MISRRSFLKVSGIAAAALAAGYGAGKITGPGASKYFSVHGFLPGDANIIAGITKLFGKKCSSNPIPVIYADKRWAGIISKVYKLNAVNNNNPSISRVTFRMMKINDNVDADIMLGDGRNFIYDPLNDFDASFTELRKRVQNMKAEYIFSAEYSESDLFSALFKSNKSAVVIENEKGIFDRIDPDKNFKNIEIAGPLGKTAICIANGLVKVNSAPCRHQLCMHTGVASGNGDIIACAPNKILIRIGTI